MNQSNKNDTNNIIHKLGIISSIISLAILLVLLLLNPIYFELHNDIYFEDDIDKENKELMSDAFQKIELVRFLAAPIALLLSIIGTVINKEMYSVIILGLSIIGNCCVFLIIV